MEAFKAAYLEAETMYSEAGYKICFISAVFCVILTVSYAAFDLRNFTQGIKYRGERNAIWDSPFERAVYLPGENIPRHRGDRNLKEILEYVPLCNETAIPVELNDGEYEYRPPYYQERICREVAATTNTQLCTFSCVQRMSTIYLARRRYDSNHWEPYSKVINSSCECMLIRSYPIIL